MSSSGIKKLKTIIGDNPILRSHTVSYPGNNVDENVQTGHRVLIQERNKASDDVGVYRVASDAIEY